jgi:hypothetical protein
MRFFSVNQETLVIPINVVAGRPHIVDLYGSTESLIVGYCFVTNTDYLLEPEGDFLVVGHELEEQG